MAAKPDLDFKRQILALDAGDLSRCYQCGTCSVVCPLSTADNPFPRKEMIWVQWGLRERALASPSIWLCHQCSTCTAYCPRDAKPASVMAALRDASRAHFAVPAFLGRALADPRYLPLLFAAPLLVFLALLAWLGHLGSLPDGQIVYSKLIPILYVEAVMVVFVGLAVLGALAGGVRYWRAMAAAPGADQHAPQAVLVPTLLTILRHRRFAECESKAPGTRETHKGHLHRTHLAVLWGFLGLVVTTTAVGIGIYGFGYPTPWPLWHPVKILGNVSGIAVIAAVAVFAWRRIADGRRAGKNTYADWLLLAVLLLTALTGLACEALRLADLPRLAYPMYVVHLIMVFFLLVYLPYSKFAHLVYRTTAMLHAASVQAARAK